MLEVGEQIGVDPRPGEDADRARKPSGIVAGVLQRLPGAFQEQPVLGIDHLGLARGEVEEGGVEPLRLGDDGTRPDIGRVREHLRVHPGGQ